MRADVQKPDSDGATRANPIPPERRDRVEAARERWIKNLIDVSRRNNLLYFRDLKKGTLDLGELSPESLAKLLGGDSILFSRLLPEGDPAEIERCVREIRRRAAANDEEKGLQTLFLAIGMATWPADDGGRAPEAPVLLIPIAIDKSAGAGRSPGLRQDGEPQVNLSLLHVLGSLGCSISAEELLSSEADVDGGEASASRESIIDPSVVFTRLKAAASGISGFAITNRAVVGNFSFQKMAMVKDLREQGEALVRHDLIAALAGDSKARDAVRKEQREIDLRELDHIPPQNEFLVLDADSSQQAVIQAVLSGQSGVIQGPPGTGKSQTISNLIAALAGSGKTLLFVAEKRAALDVVLERLKGAGLGHLVLDLHRSDVSRKALMQQIEAGLNQIRETPTVDADDVHGLLVDRRQRLNAHDADLHVSRPPSGLSAYEMMGRLLQMRAEIQTTTRWRGRDLHGLDAAAASRVRTLLIEAAGFERLFFGDSPSPWAKAPLADGEKAQIALDLVQRLRGELVPSLRRALAQSRETTGLPMPRTLQDAVEVVALLSGVLEIRSRYVREIFQVDLEEWGAGLSPAARWFLPRIWADAFNRRYRDIRTKAQALRTAGMADAAQIRREVLAAANQRARWRELTDRSAVPVEYPGTTELRQRLDEVLGACRSLAPLLDPRHGLGAVTAIPLDDLNALIDKLAADQLPPRQLPRIAEIHAKIAQLGAARILDELREGSFDPSAWPTAFDHAWLSSCLDQACVDNLSLAGFNGRTHEKFVDEFVDLDQKCINVAADRIRRAHAERTIVARNANTEQDNLLQREVRKKSRHLPLRTLLERAPEVLTAVRPCWMASPLTVSQLIGANRHYLDIVIFDEASQVLPEDAASALLRAPRAAVAGDRHQLPPTTFFAAGEDDAADSESAASGFESILDLMESVFAPAWRLQWHYRSRDEALIAFSNQEIYSRGLITFPGVGGEPAVSHVLVRMEAGRDGKEVSPAEEVQRVVDLVLEHAQKRSDESLGVITLGIEHANRVQAALDQALDGRGDLAEFFQEGKRDQFFIKNLERVQGDERDAIILSVGCGKDRAGRISRTQFGPLNSKGIGPRRLNVAVTRARQRMTVVSSFTHEELAVSPSGDTGTDLLRKYIEYAASGGRRLSSDGPTTIAPNPFELDVKEALEARGLKLRAQWGASSYRIDLVAEHPSQPGQFVLAIECDGASYHSAPTARDRDRLRQKHLEDLGWNFHRIWSTDWFQRRDAEIERAVKAYEAALNRRWVNETTAPATGRPSAQNGTEDAQVSILATGPSQRHSRPKVPSHGSIGVYSKDQIDSLIRWIKSDGRLRTDEEIIAEMVTELGFKRRGSQIEKAIGDGIRRVSETEKR